MARRITASQLRSKIRQSQARQKRAIDDYNRAVRGHNRKVQRAIGDYNRAVRAHNSKVRAHRQRLRSELARLRGRSSSTYSSSARVLYQSFTRIETRFGSATATDREKSFLEASEREAANSLAVANALEGNEAEDQGGESSALGDTLIDDELRRISPDLDRRWRGALFSLSPWNPDAARHFCTSAREVFTRFLDLHAPDHDVVRAFPTCDMAPNGRPTRRMRLKLLLLGQGLDGPESEEFASRDVDNVLELFRVFNDGTHGSAGTFSLAQLVTVKRRVEDSILFLASLVR